MKYTAYAGSYFGIPVRIHWTFPLMLLGFGAEAWFREGPVEAFRVAAMILLVFLCVVLHEFGHSLQILRYGIKVRDIVLLPIGGMARAERIPEKPWQEIVVAISGPLVNFVLAAVFFVILQLRGQQLTIDDGFITNLFFINIVLGTFNLIPAFPMDGGRILRGMLAIRLPYLRATRVAKGVGQIIALGFIVLGFVNQSFLMLPVIAVFIFIGASNEESMIRVRYVLGERRLHEFADRGNALPDNTTVENAIGYIANSTRKSVPAVDASGRLVGITEQKSLLDARRRGQMERPIGEITTVYFPVLDASMGAAQAYYFLKAEKLPFAAVQDGEDFLGMVYVDEMLDEKAHPVS